MRKLPGVLLTTIAIAASALVSGTAAGVLTFGGGGLESLLILVAPPFVVVFIVGAVFSAAPLIAIVNLLWFASARFSSRAFLFISTVCAAGGLLGGLFSLPFRKLLTTTDDGEATRLRCAFTVAGFVTFLIASGLVVTCRRASLPEAASKKADATA